MENISLYCATKEIKFILVSRTGNCDELFLKGGI
jgi:hypothetical protein